VTAAARSTWTGTDDQLEAALRACGTLTDQGPALKVVAYRVDALQLGYRVQLDPAFLEALKDASSLAIRHGRAGFKWKLRQHADRVPGPRDVSRLLGLRARWATDKEHVAGHGVWGVLGYSDRRSVWTLTCKGSFVMQILAHPPGVEQVIDPVTGEQTSEPGYSLDIKFYASFLADVGLDAALREGQAMAALCGELYGERLRRIDLCADVQGWSILHDDVNCLVKRPRAQWKKECGDIGVGKEGTPDDPLSRPSRESFRPGRPRVSAAEQREAVDAQDFGRGALRKRQITGVSVGRGGDLMARIYDKRVELERDEPRRVVEEARWKHDGWDGETRVSRVEFQIRGSVLDELGIRDPWCMKDVEWGVHPKTRRDCVVSRKPAVDADGVVQSLGDRLDWIWMTCLNWVRIIAPEETRGGNLKRPALLKDDPRWALLREVRFSPSRVAHPIKRWRHRAAASSAMTWGCALSQHARDGRIAGEIPESVLDARGKRILDQNVGQLALSFARWGVELRRMAKRRPQRFVDDATIARRFLSGRVRAVMSAAACNIVEDFIRDHDGVFGAVEHVAVRQNAAYYMHRPRRDFVDAPIATCPPDGDGPRSTTVARSGWVDDFGSREEGRAVA
jgi:hypothetical protein